MRCWILGRAKFVSRTHSQLMNFHPAWERNRDIFWRFWNFSMVSYFFRLVSIVGVTSLTNWAQATRKKSALENNEGWKLAVIFNSCLFVRRTQITGLSFFVMNDRPKFVTCMLSRFENSDLFCGKLCDDAALKFKVSLFLVFKNDFLARKFSSREQTWPCSYEITIISEIYLLSTREKTRKYITRLPYDRQLRLTK